MGTTRGDHHDRDRPGATPTVTGAPRVVVRRPDGWYAGVGEADEHPRLALPDVLGLLAGAEPVGLPPGAPRLPAALATVEPATRLRPAVSVALLVGGDGLVVETAAGAAVLGPAHLWLLDQAGTQVRAGHLVDRAEAAALAQASADTEAHVATPDRGALELALADLVALALLQPRRRERTGNRRRYFRPAAGARGGHEPTPVVVPARPDAVPVLAPWDDVHLPLGLSMVAALARERVGGADGRFRIGRPTPSAEVLAELAAGSGPAVLLCSDYQWTLDRNLDLARTARAARPGLVVVHGGPSAPKYEGDAARLFADHGDAVDVLVRGEGEVTLAEVLAALVWDDEGRPDLAALADVPGVTFRDPDAGALVRTPDRERVAELDALPSPYLSGELDRATGHSAASIETNRGCPYGCTFCDWGSATLSRVRKFDLERVAAEMRWLGERGIADWTIADANFGIFSRDVEVARLVAETKATYGVPEMLTFCVAKNTTRHLAAIVDVLGDAGVACYCALALQSQDADTLEAVDRKNIKPAHYSALAYEMRSRGLPLTADLMLGLPGQTVSSYRSDLQFLLDREITARTWPTQVLPNAPLNEPAYREAHRIETDARRLVLSTSSFTRADRDLMVRLRRADAALEQFGVLRHVLRFVQWEHDLLATDVVAHLVDEAERRPERRPLLAWLLDSFDVHTVPPVSWTAFFAEVRSTLVDDLDVPPSSGLDVVLAVQRHLLPELGRRFPDRLALAHDYVAYYDDATRGLWTDGEPTVPRRPLASYGPGELVVVGDPTDLCRTGLGWALGDRDEGSIGSFWLGDHWELDSPLTRNLAHVTRLGGYEAARRGRAPAPDPPDAAAS